MDADRQLHQHLRAIVARDLEALAATVDPEHLTLVAADGGVTFDTDTFLQRHREWFATSGWHLDWHLLHADVGTDLAVYVLALDYRRGEEQRPSVLTLAFGRRDDRWLLVFDQNTPVR